MSNILSRLPARTEQDVKKPAITRAAETNPRILAGDTLRSAADLEIPMVAVTLVHRQGYFRQRLDERGNQREEPDSWNPEALLEPTDAFITVTLEGREVEIRAWRYSVRGISGYVVPVYLLDTALPANSPWDQRLTDNLYGGDRHYRLCQETLLGMGGVQILQKLGHAKIETYYMNEGHSALLAIALLEEQLRKRNATSASAQDVEAVRRQCIFTTHTPVPAGQDKFPKDLMRQVLGEARTAHLEATQSLHDDALNMTYLGLRYSHYINGVAMPHFSESLTPTDVKAIVAYLRSLPPLPSESSGDPLD